LRQLQMFVYETLSECRYTCWYRCRGRSIMRSGFRLSLKFKLQRHVSQNRIRRYCKAGLPMEMEQVENRIVPHFLLRHTSWYKHITYGCRDEVTSFGIMLWSCNWNRGGLSPFRRGAQAIPGAPTPWDEALHFFHS
jgi:hypothetical protein